MMSQALMAKRRFRALDVPSGPNLRIFFASASLVILIAAISLLAIVLLAATLAQSRLSSVSVNGVNINIWKLDSRSADWDEIARRTSDLRKELTVYEGSRRDAAYNAYTAKAALTRSKSLLLNAVQYVAFRSNVAIPQLAADLENISDPSEKVGRIMGVQERLKADPGFEVDILARLVKSHDEYSAAKLDSELADAGKSQLDIDIKAHHDAIDRSQLKRVELISGFFKNPDDAVSAKIENAFHELTPKPFTVGWYLKFFIILQPDILSLFLVVSMGVLGSSLQIANSYFRDRRSDTAGSYFLRLGVGAVTALAIFVIGKAGVPIFADASKFGGDAPINPYFISFLAIVSGLLSERAIVSVQNQGERLFGSPQADVKRWARYDLTTMVALEGLSVGLLAGYLDLAPQNTALLLQGKEAATGAQQQTIAMAVRRSVRDLFSDLPLYVAPTSNSETPESAKMTESGHDSVASEAEASKLDART